jgi:hypothetical protein
MQLAEMALLPIGLTGISFDQNLHSFDPLRRDQWVFNTASSDLNDYCSNIAVACVGTCA